MSNSVASSRVGRNKKYNIAPEFLSSPYLSKPIGSFNEKRKKGGSPGEVSRNAKSTSRRRRGDSDAGSVASFRTNRSVSSYRTQQTYQRPSQNGARRMTSMKNFLLPREMEKLLRGFRQKSQTRFEQQKNEDDYEDDTSTIASDSAESLDDKAVYLQIRSDSKGKDGEDVFGSIFSSPIFAEIALRNCDREVSDGPIFTLPPVGILDHDKSGGGDVSDLESLHSSSSKLMVDHKLPVYSRRKR